LAKNDKWMALCIQAKLRESYVLLTKSDAGHVDIECDRKLVTMQCVKTDDDGCNNFEDI